MMTQLQETLSGLIERITFHNEENGFCVLRVKVKGHKDLVTVVGTLPSAHPGGWIEASGLWMQDRHYGQQFKALSLHLSSPTTLEGVEKYLGSGMIKGIGPIYAKKLVKTFGADVLDLIEENPGALEQVPGIGPLRRQKIIASWADQKSIRTIMLFLHSHGVSTTRAVRIYKTYGHEAVERIQENPYRLAQDMRGIGFINADQIAMNLGIERNSLIRARAGISYALTKAMEEGHCGLPIDTLLTSCKTLLEIDEPVLQSALDLELKAGTVVQQTVRQILQDASCKETPCVFLKGLYQAEQGIADRIRALHRPLLPWPSISVDLALSGLEKKNGMTLSTSQASALEMVLSHKVTIITGGPGVGKTTLLCSILKILQSNGMKLALCAPTGRAAKRMTETTGFEAQTIHRLLQMNPATGTFTHNEHNPINCTVLVVDEVSMVDVPLMHALLKAVPQEAALILVGDQDQLPSVGPGQVLADLIASHAIPFIHLTQTFRQAATSNIVTVAQAINHGTMPKLKGYDRNSDFFFIEEDNPEQALKQIIDLTVSRLPQKRSYSPFHDIQVLCPMTRGLMGSRTLNEALQKALNPPTEKSIHKYGTWYSVGDKVMQIENNYQKEVYNGDLGLIEDIDLEEGGVTIIFDEKRVHYDLHELDEISLAYAMTIHKSQGSEYPVVIIPLFTQHYPMLQKNLIYTGITRGKKLVIILGQKRAMDIAIKNKSQQSRWTLLAQHLKEA